MDENSNFSVFRVRRFTEWPGPLHSSLNCLSCRNPYQTPHSFVVSPLFTENPFFSLKCASTHPNGRFFFSELALRPPPKLSRKIPSFSQNDFGNFHRGGYPNRSSGIHRWGLDLRTGYPNTYFSWFSGYPQLTLVFLPGDEKFRIFSWGACHENQGLSTSSVYKPYRHIPFPKIGSNLNSGQLSQYLTPHVEPLQLILATWRGFRSDAVWVGQTAVIPSDRVHIWVCLFLFGWYYPSVTLHIWVCLICVNVCMRSVSHGIKASVTIT